MSKWLWNSLKASPAILGASLLVASSAHATQNPTASIVASDAATATPIELTASLEPTVKSSDNNQALNLANGNLTDATLSSAIPQSSANALDKSQQTPSVGSPSLNLADNTVTEQVQSDGVVDADLNQGILDQINQYNYEAESNPQDQVTNVSQLRDVSPGDWAYEALRSLVERYGCIAGYPDGTYRGNRATTRYEFAAGLNACLNQIERLIGDRPDAVTREDLETLQRLVQEFQAELTTLGTRVDDLEGRVGFLEDHQFSTTTKLVGEIKFVLVDAFGDDVAVPSGQDPTDDLDINTVFQDRVRLNFDTSFTGRDLLRTRFQARNAGISDQTGTLMTEFEFDGDEGNDILLRKLSYSFPVGDNIMLRAGATNFDLDDFAPVITPVIDAPSDFASLPPIYKLGGGTGAAGAGITLEFGEALRFDGMYSANEASDPEEGAGVFNGAYAAFGQLTFEPSDALRVALAYVHAFGNSPGGFDGSGFANTPFSDFGLDSDGGTIFDPDDGTIVITDNLGATTSNAYHLEVAFRLSPRIALGGWVGYTNAINEADLGAGDREIWNYAVSLALPDLGGEGNVFGLAFGMPPRNRTGRTSTPGDRDTSYHIEAFYRYQFNDNIAITPGVFVILNPEHNNANDDIFVGVLRTTFTF
jgi:hypothetical protein